MKKIIVIDTNVLLSDPQVLFKYDDSEIVIPQTVLAELDKIKLARSDREIRFRGREVSRILFELSQSGSLLEGIELDNEGTIRVSQHDPENFPPTLNSKNSDDRILSIAWRLMNDDPDSEVTLLTNDLNMLLKAQSFGITVDRHDFESRPSLGEKLMAPFKRKRLSLAWIIVPLALVGLVLGLWLFQVPSPISRPASTSVFDSRSFPLQEAQYLKVVNEDPSRSTSWFQLGHLYMDWGKQLQESANFEEARKKRESAIDSFRQGLRWDPDSALAKTSIGTAYFLLGNLNEAVSQYVQAINTKPDYALAYFNLGFVLFSQRDFDGAARQYKAYLELEPEGDRSNYARNRLSEIESDTSTP